MKKIYYIIIGILILILLVFIYFYQNKNIYQNRDNEIIGGCEDYQRIEFQEPKKEVVSLEIDSYGGMLYGKYDEDSWVVVEVPEGAVKNKTNFNLSFKKSDFIVKSGERSKITFGIFPDISFDMPVKMTIQYDNKYGCDVVPVPYLVDKDNKLHLSQLLDIYPSQNIFVMDTFHGGYYSWIYNEY